MNDVVPLFLAVEEADFHTGLNIVREALVALGERSSFDVVELEDCLVNGCGRQPRVDPPEAGLENVDEEDVVVAGIGPGHVGPVEMLVSESVDHVLDDGLLEELLVEGDWSTPIYIACPSAHSIVLSRWRVTEECMLREATCLGLLPARQASIACMLPERFLFDGCVNPPWTISVAPVGHHCGRRAGLRTGGARCLWIR